MLAGRLEQKPHRRPRRLAELPLVEKVQNDRDGREREPAQKPWACEAHSQKHP
jgi:hypothetical protein